ncbi:hypothetical protein I6B53_10680 [Schaalia sp. 19OD2882]|uniref:hypothetical protein n=1 Tax=Schaalia sp. 19OD2882 TaxID=2794089 RepID=UPI001C1F13EF|nr:hypothetical protein [Schaalia sp. 19OD2882]QWW19522.1 hypothetical protein I6B53_10680 [Schaalia sp. 19OD2882]
MILDRMGASHDMIRDRFGWGSGGIVITSDGVWYWRLDADQHIRHYPIRIPEQTLAHFEANAG